MDLVTLPILTLVFTVGVASIAFAAGGGGAAGGAGAQNQPSTGLPEGERGPLGATNHPRRPTEAAANVTAAAPPPQPQH